MRYVLFVVLCLVLPLFASAQTSAVGKARVAGGSVTAHDHATEQQAGEAVGHGGHEAPPPADAGHDAAPAAPVGQGDAASHVHPAPPAWLQGLPPQAGEPSGHVHPVPAPEQAIGVTEKLGQQIASEARFRDEGGRVVTMAEMVDKPTIIVPVYFSCPNVCAIIQSSLAAVLPDVRLEPGRDFQVISVSFDEKDTPELAAAQKRNFMAAMDFRFPETGWRFLTGDEKNIRLLTDSLGFGFRREGKDFLHPVAIMAVSPKGKIARYLYGTRPLAFDLTMAATEAGREQVGLSVKRVLAYCFSYDPEGKRYVFNFMKITGTGILAILGVLLVSLMLAGRKKRPPRQ
jgi:protein SCO1/2